MHPLNTNEEIKMKKISYFGKEYTVSDDVKWVATNLSGNVFTFTEKPEKYCDAWVADEIGKRIDIWGAATYNWENSLREVKDIIVKENKLKVGEFKVKCIDNKDHSYLTNGAIYNAWFIGGELWSGSDNDCGFQLYHGDISTTAHGVFEMIEEKSHPHADLMLKYAMISQYDDKPWENFEVLLDEEWVDCEHEGLYAGIEYRLKPQEPKIKIGQIWVDKLGVIVSIRKYSAGIVFINVAVGGLVIPWSYKREYFLNNFKLQENK